VEGLKETCPAAHRVIDLLAPALDKSGCSHISSTLIEHGTTQPMHEKTLATGSTPPGPLVSSSLMTPGIDMNFERLMSRNVFTPPASPKNPQGNSTIDSIMYEKNTEVISPSTLEQAPLSIYGLDDVGMSETFFGFNTTGSTDILFDQFFADLDLPVGGLLDSSELFI
jgi:hypothetical protein